MACGRPGAPARPPDAGGRGPAARGGFDSGAAAPVESGAGGLGEEAASGAIVRAPATDGDVLLTDVAEVRGKLRAGAPMLLIDARGRADYELEHIPGAVNVPLPKIAATGKLPGVPHDYEIVVYCSAEACPLSREAARALASFGYTNVKDMRAGLVGWKQAGFETTKGSG
jgi:rhodanese-related sulfurtransferase